MLYAFSDWLRRVAQPIGWHGAYAASVEETEGYRDKLLATSKSAQHRKARRGDDSSNDDGGAPMITRGAVAWIMKVQEDRSLWTPCMVPSATHRLGRFDCDIDDALRGTLPVLYLTWMSRLDAVEETLLPKMVSAEGTVFLYETKGASPSFFKHNDSHMCLKLGSTRDARDDLIDLKLDLTQAVAIRRRGVDPRHESASSWASNLDSATITDSVSLALIIDETPGSRGDALRVARAVVTVDWPRMKRGPP
jgi:hypothetical protein